MGIKAAYNRSPFANYVRNIRETPREIILNSRLLWSACLYAMGGIPLTWDQGASATIPSLPGFQHHFNIKSGTDAGTISTYISIIYVGYAIGAAGSFFLNDYMGRRWAFRAYASIYIIGQIITCIVPNMNGLIGARIVAGIGIGSLSVTVPMTIVEISPKEIRGLLTSWYTVSMGIALTCASLCVLGILTHIPNSRLQYQIPSIASSCFMFCCILCSFFASESPRWLLLVGRREEAVETLVKLRGLPENHPRVSGELSDIEHFINAARGDVEGKPKLLSIVKETFTIRSNLRRLQQVLVSYALAQLSGANSITSCFVPIMSLLGNTGGTKEHVFLSGMCGFAKLRFSIIASFFLIDAIGRRRSLFIGITIQLLSHIYIAVYLKYNAKGEVSGASSGVAVAALFIHGFGYAVGRGFILPYVFGGELWPTRIRSFGGAVGQTFHWLFIYAVKFALPDILESMDTWGAFLFFAGWCFLGLIYTYLMVPEVAGLSVEGNDAIFEGPWYNSFRRSKHDGVSGIEAEVPSHGDLDKNGETQISVLNKV